MTVDITRDKSKKFKKEKEKKKKKKNEKNSKKSLFNFTFLHSYFVRKHIWKNLVYIVTIALPFFFTWKVIGNAVTPTPI